MGHLSSPPSPRPAPGQQGAIRAKRTFFLRSEATWPTARLLRDCRDPGSVFPGCSLDGDLLRGLLGLVQMLRIIGEERRQRSVEIIILLKTISSRTFLCVLANVRRRPAPGSQVSSVWVVEVKWKRDSHVSSSKVKQKP